MRGLLLFSVLALLPVAGADSSEVPQALLWMEEAVPLRPGHVSEAAPVRFALLEDGQVFVGGSSEILTTRLSPREVKDWEKRLAEIRKHPALAGTVELAPGPERRRLVFRGGKRPLDMVLVGDPAKSRPALRALADFVTELARYHHPGLRPYTAGSLALSAREGSLPGGCRRWTRPEPVTEAVFAPRIVPPADFDGWPRGTTPAFVCAGDKTYVVTLRPLLPGER